MLTSQGMVIVKMIGFLELDSSEMFRLNDKLRRNPKQEVRSFLTSTHVRAAAVGTTQGNLSPVTRSTYLPILVDFLQCLLVSLLDWKPQQRLTAAQAKQKADVLFATIFSGNDFFRPKIGAK